MIGLLTNFGILWSSLWPIIKAQLTVWPIVEAQCLYREKEKERREGEKERRERERATMSAEIETVLATLRQNLASCSTVMAFKLPHASSCLTLQFAEILEVIISFCVQLIAAGDYATSEQSIAELVNFLNSISESLIEGEPQYSQELAVEIVTQIHQYVAVPALEQVHLRIACFHCRFYVFPLMLGW